MQDKELKKRTRITKEKKQDAYQVAEEQKNRKEPEFEERRRIANQQKSQAFKAMG